VRKEVREIGWGDFEIVEVRYSCVFDQVRLAERLGI
jgi:hypothetical protein